MKTLGTYFARHFESGVAGYGDYKVFISQDAAVRMNNSFAGKPLFVSHVDDESAQPADGLVKRSFYLPQDGTFWAEIEIYSPQALAAIQAGYRVSNCYQPTKKTSGGKNKGVSYAEEVLDGEYLHLALVRDPRYENAIVLSEFEFKRHCQSKRKLLPELPALAIANSGYGVMKENRCYNSTDFQTVDTKLFTYLNGTKIGASRYGSTVTPPVKGPYHSK